MTLSAANGVAHRMTPRADLSRMLARERRAKLDPATPDPLPARAGWAWRPHQREALAAWGAGQATGAGLLLPQGVGAGKTHILLGCALLSLRSGASRVLYATSSPLVAQITHRDWPAALAGYGPSADPPLLTTVGVPTHAARMDLVRVLRDCPQVIYVVSYSMISQTTAPGATGAELLAAIDPQVILCDEAHVLRSLDSAVTRRLLARVDPPRVRWAFASGTLTNHGTEDYAHLAACALQSDSPAPISPGLRRAMDDVIGAGARPSTKQVRALVAITRWAGDESTPTVESLRRAWRERLTSHPYVVATNDERPDAALTVERREYRASEALDALMVKLDREWVSPDGEECSDHLRVWHWRYQLLAGFYYRTIYETEVDRERAMRKNRYHAALRNWLQESWQPGLDSPSLAEASMNELPERIQRLYAESREEPHGRVEPVRVCGGRMKSVSAWLEEGPGIAWFVHDEVGQWLRELNPSATYCPAGDAGTAALLAAGPKDRVIASMRAYGKGFNLQRWSRMAFAQWPRGAAMAEQVLGRMHRSGQEADRVTATWWAQERFGHDQAMVEATLADASYAHQAMQPQRLLYCDHSPPALGRRQIRGLFDNEECAE